MILAIALVCAGVGISTVTDSQMGSNVLGWAVGGGAVLSTAAYQLWAGSMQKGASCCVPSPWTRAQLQGTCMPRQLQSLALRGVRWSSAA